MTVGWVRARVVPAVTAGLVLSGAVAGLVSFGLLLFADGTSSTSDMAPAELVETVEVGGSAESVAALFVARWLEGETVEDLAVAFVNSFTLNR